MSRQPPVTAPISERQDTVAPVSVISESSATAITNETISPLPSEETASLTAEESTPAPAETPVDPRISEIRVIHRRRTLKPDFSPVASSTDIVYKTVNARAFTEYDVSGNGPATVTDENGKTWYRVRYSDLDIKDGFSYNSAPEKGTATAPVIEVIHLYDDIDLNPEVVKRARFVDERDKKLHLPKKTASSGASIWLMKLVYQQHPLKSKLMEKLIPSNQLTKRIDLPQTSCF